MPKLITGQQALIALANGTSIHIQRLQDGHWSTAIDCTVLEFLQNAFQFRVAPTLIKIGNVEIEAAETEALPEGSRYYTPNLADGRLHREIYWYNTSYNQANLRYGVVHLSLENAEAHAKALILASGGKLDDEPAPTPDPEPVKATEPIVADEPPRVPNQEGAPATEKKQRSTAKKSTTKAVVDPAPVAVNDEPEFITPPAVVFDEPQPDDLENPPELSRVDKLLDDIAEAATVEEINTIITRYTVGLSDAEYTTVNDAAVKRRGILAPHLRVEPEPLPIEARINAAQNVQDLAGLVPKIDILDLKTQELYNKRRLVLLDQLGSYNHEVIKGTGDPDTKVISQPSSNPYIKKKPEKPSLAARIEDCRTTTELKALLPEIEAVDPVIKGTMYGLYNKRLMVLG